MADVWGWIHILLYLGISNAWSRIHIVSMHSRCLGPNAYVILQIYNGKYMVVAKGQVHVTSIISWKYA